MELVITFSLLMTVAFPAGLMLVNSVRLYESERGRIELHQTAQIAMSGIRSTLFNASGIDPAETGPLNTDGFVEVRRLDVITRRGTEAIVIQSDGVLVINGKPQAKGILFEAKPLDGTFDDCHGLLLRITAYKGNGIGVGSEQFSLSSRVYFRNGV